MKIIHNTSILTELGYKKIQDLTPHDKLIYNDSLSDIESIKKEDYNGYVYRINKSINFKPDPFMLLPENRLLVLSGITQSSKDKRLFDRYNSIAKKPANIYVNGHKKYDMIVGARVRYTSTNSFNLTKNDCRFIGIIIANGSLQTDKRCNNRVCNITIRHDKEPTMIFVKKYLKEQGIYYGIKEKEPSSVVVFTCTNIEWLSEEYIYNNKQKIIHDKFKNLNNDLLIQLLRGMIEVDGCLKHKETQAFNQVAYYSSSEELIYDIMYVCRKFDMIVGGNVVKEKGITRYIRDIKITTKYDNYAITIPLQFKLLLQHFNYSDETLTKAVQYFNTHNEQILERILLVTKEQTESHVYDINIKNKNYIHTFNGVIG